MEELIDLLRFGQNCRLDYRQIYVSDLPGSSPNLPEDFLYLSVDLLEEPLAELLGVLLEELFGELLAEYKRKTFLAALKSIRMTGLVKCHPFKDQINLTTDIMLHYAGGQIYFPFP